MQKEDYLFSLVIIAIGISIAAIISLINLNHENLTLEEKIASLQTNFNKLNNTQTNLIKYIAERNEPFMKEVVKYANETNLRIEKLENQK